MDILHECCAGLDVHKKTIMVCVRRETARKSPSQKLREFGTTTREILSMADWFAEEGVTHVAMESTGIFWKPIFNLLEGRFSLMLCNAQHIKGVPGHKTDVKDAEWIAQLLQHGLLKPSFVPPRALRHLRDLTRHRAQLVAERTRVANRIHKILEDANIKLASVATDVLGVSGRDMIQAMIRGESNEAILADKARTRLREKIPQLREALHGGVTEHHRFMLKLLLEHLTFLEGTINRVSEHVESVIARYDDNAAHSDDGSLPLAEAVRRLVEIPGLDMCTAENILAEIGPDMSQFAAAKKLVSWAGLCPGNNESAGKRKPEKTTKGNRWLRRSLGQSAWAARSSKNTYFSAQYRRIAGRRGKKRAIVAVAHSILVTIYEVLRTKRSFADLGADHFDHLNPAAAKRYFVKRLQDLGYEVILKEAPLQATG
jgi:transposase